MTSLAVISLALLTSGASQAASSRCTEDIQLINGVGCTAPCCTQDSHNSGHYIFAHESVEKIDIRNNPPSVVSVSFPNLQSIEKLARISFNQAGSITRVSFPSLRVAGALDMTGNPGLVEVDLPRLMSIYNDESDARLRIQSNGSLATLNAPLLETVFAGEAGSAYLQLRFNPALEEIQLPALREIGAAEDYSEAYIFIDANDGVRDISMNALQRLSAGSQSISWMVLDELPSLERLSFPQLRELTPTGGAYDFSELTVAHSPNLAELEFPRLARVSVVQLSGLKGTRKAMFPELSELQYLWVFRSCASRESTLKMYICSDQAVKDVHLNNDDALCGPAGYMLYSPNASDTAACDASDFCQSFIPDVTEFHCTGH